eukprot:TRINITY_DN6970_c0_g1_i3.p1 TRINITY_DN6970_c0_g1~~TRINITY_DN6970_c0_g1_i3.p1  ORF type:complete len:147 (-),score=22.50 TRINITY_DN6970_c0_g1_i3:140-580(-)
MTFLNPDFPEEEFVRLFPLLRERCSCISLYGDEADSALRWSERINRRGRGLGRGTPSLGRALRGLRAVTPAGASNFWLDMDVIDTSWMENNVHTVRHNYFTLNRELVEDLRELIVARKRATVRDRLLHRTGNVYSFLAAPSCVVNP